jgi:hypothetical protein
MELAMCLSAEQRRSLEIGEPVRGQVAGLKLVIVREGHFEQIKDLLPDTNGWSAEETRALAARTLNAADFADPIY